MKKQLFAVLLSVGFLSQAYAAPVSTDIILGFRATGGAGATQNLEINLGTIASLKATSGFVTNITSATNGANGVDSIYGAGWASDANLFWGAIGAQTTGNQASGLRTVFATQSTGNSSPLGVQSTTAYTQQSFLGAATSTADISLLYQDFGASGPIIGQSYATGATTAGSWTQQEGLTTNPFDNTFNFHQLENTANISGDFVASDLYELDARSSGTVGNPGKWLGTLSIFANGDVKFDPVAIPEPSIYAVFLGVACMGVVMVKRKQSGRFAL